MVVAATSLAQGRVRALCRRGLHARAFRLALRGRLHALVPFDGYCVNTADPSTLAVTSSVGDGLSGAQAAHLFAIEARGTDVNPLRELARARVTVATVGARPERSERMRDIFLPQGWVDELRAALVERGQCWGYLHLFRSTPFRRRETRAVASVSRDLAAALRVAAARGDASVRSPEPAVLVVQSGGHVLARTRAGRELLDAVPSDEKHGGIPHALVDAAERALVSGVAAESHVASTRGLLRVVAAPETSCAVVVVDQARPSAIAELAFAAHRLSPREVEVGRAMLRGLSDAAIASRLGMGTHTVKTHAKALFAKLDVAGRNGLLAKLAPAQE